MRFEQLQITGAVRVLIEPARDARGFFARTFCTREFEANGLPVGVVQASISYNERCGTVRGLHFQWSPSKEDKFVRCIRGRLLDVLLDLRPDSPTYLQHCAVALDDESRDAVFIPQGVAHGFQTLVDQTEVLYQMTDFYAPDLSAGVRWNDPVFGIRWPLPPALISQRDANYADFDSAWHQAEVARRHGQLDTA